MLGKLQLGIDQGDFVAQGMHDDAVGWITRVKGTGLCVFQQQDGFLIAQLHSKCDAEQCVSGRCRFLTGHDLLDISTGQIGGTGQ